MSTASTSRTNGQSDDGQGAELGHVPVWKIRPSPENDQLYRPINPEDPEIIALSESIRDRGLLEPLAITVDGYILSGHRRFAAAKLAGLTEVQCRIIQIHREGNIDEFVRLLREHNRQRDKSRDEKLREELVSINPDDAHAELWRYRRTEAAVKLKSFKIVGSKHRCEISTAKQPLLQALLKIIHRLKSFWPTSDRRIHYGLLNDPPLIHASKPKSRYKNDSTSYKALTEILTRARLAGFIPYEAIGDETRPVLLWEVHADSRAFVREQLGTMFRGYWRNLQQSQPNHVEIIVEKNTVAPIVKSIAGEYCIPLTSGRGFASLPPRQAMAERFKTSGKEKLVVLIVSDHDPDGEEIAQSFARSMRDDFDVAAVHPIKVALTRAQVQQYRLGHGQEPKRKSTNYQKFIECYGKRSFEIEALEPATLQQILRTAIESVIDQAAYAAEIEAEKKDAAFLAEVRTQVSSVLSSLRLDDKEADSDG
jgi:hypothetical protein